MLGTSSPSRVASIQGVHDVVGENFEPLYGERLWDPCFVLDKKAEWRGFQALIGAGAVMNENIPGRECLW